MQAKHEAVRHSALKIFNANAATLLASLKLGLAGYSGVMANFHPELYAWMWQNWQTAPAAAQRLQDFLGSASLIERQVYPVNAKYYLQLEGLPLTLHTRSRACQDLTSSARLEVVQWRAVAQRYWDAERSHSDASSEVDRI